MSIHVHLDRFEGPLGLLLHLIREQEMDIFNIDITQITRQYLEYIKTMRRLDLEVAGEFVAMAATLLHIKSRMLLPQYNEEGEVVAEDPRKELVNRLLEYQKFKELSGDLYKRPLLGRDVYPRGEVTDVEAVGDGEVQLEENPLFSLIASYRVAMKNMKKTYHRVSSELQSIASRIMELKDYLIIGKRVMFSELITAETTPVNRGNQVLVTFLSLLELMKMGFISVFQSEAFADIHIDPRREIDRDIVSRVENYDAVNAEFKADQILNQAQLSLDENITGLDEEGDGMPAAEVTASAELGASDDEIFAEEMKMAQEDGGEVGTEDVALTGIVFPTESDQEATASVVATTEHLADITAQDLAPEPLVQQEAPSAETVASLVNQAAAAFKAFESTEDEFKPEEPAVEPPPPSDRDPEVQT